MPPLLNRNVLRTRNVFVAIVAVGLFAMAAKDLTDPDIWWHLQTGRLTLANHAVFRTDPYSFTRAGQPWINHEWLFDVCVFALFRAGGPAALILTFGAITAAGFLLLFLRCEGNPFIAGFVIVWAAVASIPTWGIRPQMISLFLTSLVLLLRDSSLRCPRLWWWMVPITLFWVNLHAEFALGISLLALFVLGDVADAVLGCATWPETIPRLRVLGLVLLACLAVVPLNPYGPRMYSYPIATVRSAAMQRYIVEWFSPNFHLTSYLPLLLFLLATLAAVAYSPRRLRPSQVLLLIATMLAALFSVRHVPIFLLVAAPVLCGIAPVRWRSNGRSGPRAHVPPTIAIAALNVVLLLAAFSVAIFHVDGVIARQPQAESAQFPEAAASFLSSHFVPGPMFNAYDWGGYFIWKLYPEYRVCIDGRADVYGDALLTEYANTYTVTHDWRKLLDRWQIQAIVVPRDAPLLQVLGATQGWTTVYSDARSVVLRRAL